ncbi:MAG: hypothetical protein HYT93_04610 [Parcubacteria group bacterium]|nr:hypothetical protein [Parcubacteria group bacterium]
MTTTTKIVIESLTPLIFREIRPIMNWHEWLQRWNTTNVFDEMLGLLHVGFDVPLHKCDYSEPEYSSHDRIQFYLTIADGWEDAFLFRPQGKSLDELKYYNVHGNRSNRNSIGEHELRQFVARKAFYELVDHFFKLDEQGPWYEHFEEKWNEWLKPSDSPNLFVAVQKFFRTEKNFDHIVIRNLPVKEEGRRSHQEKQVIQFLRKFIHFIWESEEDDAIIGYAKPWSIGILSALGELNTLRKWIFMLDKKSLEKLKELALQNELKDYKHPVSAHRLVKSVEEACFIGSPEALLLVEHKVRTKERARLVAIQKAEEKKAEAERNLQKLTHA